MHNLYIFIFLLSLSGCNTESLIEKYISSENLPYSIVNQQDCSNRVECTQTFFGCKSILKGDLTGDGTEDNVCIVKDKEDDNTYNIFILHTDEDGYILKSFLIGTYNAQPAVSRIDTIEDRIFDEQLIPDQMNWTISKAYDVFSDADSVNVIVIQDNTNTLEIRFDRGLGFYEVINHTE